VFLNPRAGGTAEGLPSVLSLVGLVARGSDGNTRSARGAGRLGFTPGHRRYQRHQDRHRRDGDPRSPTPAPGRRVQGSRLSSSTAELEAAEKTATTNDQERDHMTSVVPFLLP